MQYVLFALVAVAFVGALATGVMLTISAAVDFSMGDLDTYVWGKLGIGLVLMVGCIALIFAAADGDPKGPCVRTESGSAYNPATKTMAPYTRCAEYGTWQ